MSLYIGANNGGSQLMLTSQWASRNTITSPLASFAPCERVRIKPSRSLFRTSLTFPSNCVMYCSSSLFRCSEREHTLQTAHNNLNLGFNNIKVNTFSKCFLWNFTYLIRLNTHFMQIQAHCSKANHIRDITICTVRNNVSAFTYISQCWKIS